MNFKTIAQKIRSDVLEMCIKNGGHIASSFSCIEILLALYIGKVINISPALVNDERRDRFFLSKGHAETVLYAVLCESGFFSESWLEERYRQGDHMLSAHPDCRIPGVEWTTGSLGHALGVASGFALAAKMDNIDRRHFVLMGDAECTEGSIWEAALFASAHKLENLIAIIDSNGVSALEHTDNFTSLGDFQYKWRSFGWNVLECNGHDTQEIITKLKEFEVYSNVYPSVLIANTVKGRGVSFMENEPLWHVKQINNSSEVQMARAELSLKAEHE